MPFHKIEGYAIVRTKGVFRQCALYQYNVGLYAKIGGGFVKLYRSGTSRPDDVLVELDTPGTAVNTGKFGAFEIMFVPPHKKVLNQSAT